MGRGGGLGTNTHRAEPARVPIDRAWAGLVPCFLGPGLGPPIVLGPFENLQGTYQEQTNLFMQTVQALICAAGSTSKGVN